MSKPTRDAHRKLKVDWAVKFLISQGHEITEQADIDACTTPLRVTLQYLRAERAAWRRAVRKVQKASRIRARHPSLVLFADGYNRACDDLLHLLATGRGR